MIGHLVAVTVGPVQDFIAAARRTRDLWFGSYLLSEVSKAAAKAVREHGGNLIFPAPRDDADLAPDSPLSVANVIVAEISGADPAAVAGAAKQAARRRWRDFADRVFDMHQGVIDASIWNEQLDDVVEIYAAWQTYTTETYQADRAALMRLLGARKRCRDFLPAKGRAGVPKSSLDGLRESVLRKERPEGSRPRLPLREGEHLDVVGMVKRTWAPDDGAPRYPSVARVAADPWLRRIPSDRLEALAKACRAADTGIIHEIDVSQGRGHPRYAAFPFEGTAVFRSRHHDLREEADVAAADLAPLADALRDLERDHKEPSPYLGVLVADGDRMGQALSALNSLDKHRKFSRALADFASKSREIVHEHNGVLVYAGGDDVLAFVPVDHCLDCARALHDAFGEALKAWSEETGIDLTFSVGFAVAHFMEPLEDLLAYGRAAEKHAKHPRDGDGQQDDRNGLAVHVVKRGGGPLAVRANWSDNPDQRLKQLAQWIEGQSVSGRVAYDLHKIAEVYETWPPETAKAVIQSDVRSTLKKKQPSAASGAGVLDKIIEDRVGSAASLRSLANDLLVARALSP